MAKDKSGIDAGTVGQTFIQGEKVMIRRLGDGNEYRAKISGIAVDSGYGAKNMIVEIVDPYKNSEDYPFTHANMPEACIDKESWNDD